MKSKFIEKTLSRNLTWLPYYEHENEHEIRYMDGWSYFPLRGDDFAEYGDAEYGEMDGGLELRYDSDDSIKKCMHRLIQCRGIVGSAGPAYDGADSVLYGYEPIRKTKKRNEDRIAPVEREDVAAFLFGEES